MAKYSREGADITDEGVACTTAVVIGATTYYEGRLTQLAANSILGATDPDYGIWTAVSKGGTRLTVVEAAVPADSSEAAIDLASGRLLSTSSRTVYARYRGHGSFLDDSVLNPPSFFILTLTRSVRWTTGTTKDWLQTAPPVDLNVVAYLITAAGSVPAANVSLALRDATGGTGNAASDFMALSMSSNSSGWQTLSTPFAVTTADLLVARGDGKNMSEVTIQLKCEPV